MAFLGLKPESMFHQRLVLLGALVATGMIAPVAQLARWTLWEGEKHKKEAEGYLSTWRWLPTTRGQILDRKGRVLATDGASFDIAVDYRVITGQWAYTQGYNRAKRLHREEWSKISPAARRELAEKYEPDFQAHLDAMWDQFALLGGIPRDELEARKDAVKKRVQELAATFRRNQRARNEQQAAEAGVEPKAKDAGPIAEELQAHVLLRHVNDRTAFDFIRRTASADEDASDATAPMPGVEVIDTGTREYPLDTVEVSVGRSTFPGPIRSDATYPVSVEGVATHVLGWMRHRVYREDNADEYLRPRPTMLPDGTPDRSLYLDGESIGQSGIERWSEPELRGLRGIQTTKLDTRELVETPAIPGKDIALTLDVMLQAEIQALFMPQLGLTVVQPWHITREDDDEIPPGVPILGEPLAGAAVVIEVATGEILAMVSAPTFSHVTLRDQPDVVFQDKLMMTSLNRAISQPYAPGSIVKPLVLCAAVTAGKYSTSERIACTGHYYPNQPNVLQCWTKKQFLTNHNTKFGHDLDGKDAINGSCNIFFYEMGHRLGPEGIVSWFEKFGVGRQAVRWNLGLGDEYPGSVPEAGSKSGPLTREGAILMGIGQGPIAWTPLHAADAYATLGRAGVRIIPRLRRDLPARTIDLHLDPRGVEQAMAGLAAAARDDVNGTAHHITVIDPATGLKKRENIFSVMELPGISVWAKSGTADAAALVARDDAGHKELLRDGDHAWCVFLVGDEGLEGRAKYAVSVVVDYGGSGGRVAGPIGNQIVHALIDHGYLHPRSEAPTPPAKDVPKGAEEPRAAR